MFPSPGNAPLSVSGLTLESEFARGTSPVLCFFVSDVVAEAHRAIRHALPAPRTVHSSRKVCCDQNCRWHTPISISHGEACGRVQRTETNTKSVQCPPAAGGRGTIALHRNSEVSTEAGSAISDADMCRCHQQSDAETCFLCDLPRYTASGSGVHRCAHGMWRSS